MASSTNSKTKKNQTQNIKVILRVRPLSVQEEFRNIIKYSSSKEIQIKDKKFQYDRVYKPGATQFEVYKGVVAPMIPDVIAGYNCTVFAYGQTGTGKTYTMSGIDCFCPEDWKMDNSAGCIPRAATHIFSDLQLMNKSETNVSVSYLELYNEEIRDLLSDDDNVLGLYNDCKGILCIQGLKEVIVHDSNALCKQLRKGITKRQTAPTLMNHQSSRSHTVFTITIHLRESSITGEDVLKTGKINLVDLAGSENIGRSGCRDLRALELANINRSLLTLGRVISILAEKSKKHVPYRDSKLTRILQDSLGGHTKTCIIATVSPADNCHEETISTLEYALRARDIKNNPTVNERLTKTKIIQSLMTDIERLQKDLDATREKYGIYIDPENYQKLKESIQEAEAMKSTLLQRETELIVRIKDLEKEMQQKVIKFEEYVEECKRSKQALLKAKSILREQNLNLKQEQFVSSAFETKANETLKTAQELFQTAHSLSREKEILKEKLDTQYHINASNETSAKSTVIEIVETLNGYLMQFENTDSDKHISSCKLEIYGLVDSMEDSCKEIQNILLNSEVAFCDAHEISKNLMKEYIGSIRDHLIKSLDSLKPNGPYDRELHSLTVKSNDTFTQTFDNVLGRLSSIDSDTKDFISMEQILLNDINEDRKIIELSQKRIKKKLALLKIIDATKKKISDQKSVQLEVKDEINNIQNQMQEFLQNFKKAHDEIINNIIIEITKQQQSTDHIADFLDNSKEMRKALECLQKDITRQNTEMKEQIKKSSVNIIEGVDAINENADAIKDSLKTLAESITEQLKTKVLDKLVAVVHEGNTPVKRQPIVYPNVKEVHTPRDHLIERFKKQNRKEVDKENSSDLDFFNITISSTSSEEPQDLDLAETGSSS